MRLQRNNFRLLFLFRVFFGVRLAKPILDKYFPFFFFLIFNFLNFPNAGAGSNPRNHTISPWRKLLWVYLVCNPRIPLLASVRFVSLAR